MNINDTVWRTYEPSTANPWGLRRAKHLWRRAGFGATWGELQRDIGDGPDKAIDRILSGTSRLHGTRDDFEQMAQIITGAAVGSDDPLRLKASWIFRMMFTPDPLREKLTLMWHNHFATSNLKVSDLSMMQVQNDLLRAHSTSKFAVLLKGVIRDPAMLKWLDAAANRKQHPNENLARELMELFTLGVGNYSEQDVRESARALSGWTLRRDQAHFRVDRHDESPKSILGETDKFDADSLVDLLLKNEATSRRLAWRLCDMLMGESAVNDEALTQLSDGLREHQLDIGWAVETILRSELFFSDANIGTRISSPVEYVVGSVRSMEMLTSRPPSTLILSGWCTRMEQDLFYPPNVGGWSGGRSWLTSRTVVSRANFANAMVTGKLRSPTEPPSFDRLTKEIGASEHSTAHTMAELLISPVIGEETLAAVASGSVNEVVENLLRRPEAILI